MDLRIRQGVFETNSSSSHDLAIAKDTKLTATFKKESLRDGEFTVMTDDYGWEWTRYYCLEGKLRYLITGMFAGQNINEDETESLKDQSFEFAQLYDMIESVTGVKLKVCGHEGSYIDHESAYEWNKAFADETTLRNFLFSEDSYVQTGNDNDKPPAEISSDKGTVPFYIDNTKTVPDEHDYIHFVLEEHGEPRTPEGTKINDEALSILKNNGVVIATMSMRDVPDRHERSSCITKAMSELSDKGFFFIRTLAAHEKFRDPYGREEYGRRKDRNSDALRFKKTMLCKVAMSPDKIAEYSEALKERPLVIKRNGKI